MSNHMTWLEDAVNPERMKICAKHIAKKLNRDKKRLGINAIAITGFSGSVIGSVVSYLTDLPLILVRKEGESKHSSREVEFSDSLEDLNYCIIDEFIMQGGTVKRIVKLIEEWNMAYNNTLVKIYLYKDSDKKFEIDDKVYPVDSFRYCDIAS